MISERLEVSKLLFRSKIVEWTSPLQHVLKINEYIERLDQLCFWMHHELNMNLILASLPDSFSQFVFKYRMNNMVSTIPKLIDLLNTTKPSLRKEEEHVMLMDTSSSKNKKKTKSN